MHSLALMSMSGVYLCSDGYFHIRTTNSYMWNLHLHKWIKYTRVLLAFFLHVEHVSSDVKVIWCQRWISDFHNINQNLQLRYWWFHKSSYMWWRCGLEFPYWNCCRCELREKCIPQIKLVSLHRTVCPTNGRNPALYDYSSIAPALRALHY